MYLRQMQDAVGDRLNDMTLKADGDNSARSKDWINETYIFDILALRNQWWFLQKQGTLTSIDAYTTGTVSVTNGSTTVTGSGTTFTAAMVGRKIKLDSYDQAFRISAFTSATSITLEAAWEDDTASAQNYQIVKDRYDLPRWLDHKRIHRIVDRDNDFLLQGEAERYLDGRFPSRSEVGDARWFIPGPRNTTTYNTGTVSGTAATKTLTGASTSWTSTDLEEFDLIRVGNYVYTVDSVDSDTQITTKEDIVTTIAASTSYTATLDRWTIELYPMPDEARTYYVIGTPIVQTLEDDADCPEMPDMWHRLIVKGAIIKALKHNQDPGVEVELAEYSQLLDRFTGENQREDYRTESWWGGRSLDRQGLRNNL